MFSPATKDSQAKGGVPIGEVSLSLQGLVVKATAKEHREWFPLTAMESSKSARVSGDVLLSARFFSHERMSDWMEMPWREYQASCSVTETSSSDSFSSSSFSSSSCSPEPSPMPSWNGLLAISGNRSDSEELQLSSSDGADCVACGVCELNSTLSPSVDMLALPCGHQLCSRCLHAMVSRFIASPGAHSELSCSVGRCGEAIPEHALRQLLGPSELERYLEATMQRYYQENPSVLRCPSCGILIERVESSTTARSSHYDRFRIRCRSCSAAFCSSCSQHPYHEGLSCKDHQLTLLRPPCRFCGKPIAPQQLPSSDSDGDGSEGNPQCRAPACLVAASQTCQRVLACGHRCYGARDESACLPCLHRGCGAAQTDADLCSVCYVDPLAAAPCVQLRCGHVFHLECVRQKLTSGWTARRISFHFACCPLCNARIAHEEFSHELRRIAVIEQKVLHLGLLTLEHEAIEPPDGCDPADFVLRFYSFYMCMGCKKPFFAGRAQCGPDPDAHDIDHGPSMLLCPGCQDGSPGACPIHASDFLLLKCQFCCCVATWRCWGSTSFCDACHKKQVLGTDLTKIPPHNLPRCLGTRCPLKIPHPPPGTPFSLGCFLCTIQTDLVSTCSPSPK